MSKAHLPPIPPANRSPMGGTANPNPAADIPESVARDNVQSKNRNLEQQGRQGNIQQNTNNQGRQQDR